MHTWHDGLPAQQPILLPLPQRPGMRFRQHLSTESEATSLRTLDTVRYWLEGSEHESLQR